MTSLSKTETLHSFALFAPRHTRSLESKLDILNMGQRNNNRKRVRHRPNRTRKYFNYQPSPIQPIPFNTTPSAMSIRYIHLSNTQFLKPGLSRTPSLGSYSSRSSSTLSKTSQEDAHSRDIRIFGGLEDEEFESEDLRGPMLDVVLGLWNSTDYDDSLC